MSRAFLRRLNAAQAVVGFLFHIVLAVIAEERSWRPAMQIRFDQPPMRIPVAVVDARGVEIARDEANIGLDRTMNSAARLIEEGERLLHAVHGRSLRALGEGGLHLPRPWLVTPAVRAAR